VSAAGGDDFLSLKFEADLSQVRADLERVEQTPVKVRLEPQQAARPTGGAAQGLTPGEVRYALGQPGGTFGPGLQSLGSEGVRRMQTQLGVRPFDLPELARGNVSPGGRQAASFAGSPASEAFDTRYENRLAGDADRLRREDERRRKEDERASRGAQRSLSGELSSARLRGVRQSRNDTREREAVLKSVGADLRRRADDWARKFQSTQDAEEELAEEHEDYLNRLQSVADDFTRQGRSAQRQQQSGYNRFSRQRGGGGSGARGGGGGFGGGGSRLFSLRGIASFTGAGFVLREGLRVAEAYMELQRDRGLAGGNQSDLLAAELKFHDTLETIPIFGEVKKLRDFDARTAVIATQRTTAAEAARADRIYDTRLGLQSSRRGIDALEAGERNDFEGRRAVAANRYANAELAARAEREDQAKLDQGAVEARRGALYAAAKQGIGSGRGLEGRLVSYFLDDRIRNFTEGALSRQSSGMGFQRQQNYQSAVDVADRVRQLELRQIDREERPALFRSGGRVRSNLLRGAHDPLGAELAAAIGETVGAVSEVSGPEAKGRAFAEGTTGLVSMVAASVREATRRGLASSGELSVTQALLRHDPLGARLAEIDTRRRQELADTPTGVSGYVLDLFGAGPTSVNARADAQKRLAIDEEAFSRKQLGIGLEGERQQLLAQLHRDPIGAEAAGISAAGRIRADELIRQKRRPEALQALNNAMLQEDVLKQNYLNSFRAEQVDLANTFVGNRRDAQDPAEVVKAITDFKNELGKMIKDALSDLVSN
jgi:hypothetical protein